MCDVCNRSRCVGCFYLYLAAISSYIVSLPVYVCMLEYLLQTSEVLRIFPKDPTPGGSGNFLGGSELLTNNSLSVFTCHMHHVISITLLLHPSMV
jgi:hypothetical protein